MMGLVNIPPRTQSFLPNIHRLTLNTLNIYLVRCHLYLPAQLPGWHTICFEKRLTILRFTSQHQWQTIIDPDTSAMPLDLDQQQ